MYKSSAKIALVFRIAGGEPFRAFIQFEQLPLRGLLVEPGQTRVRQGRPTFGHEDTEAGVQSPASGS